MDLIYLKQWTNFCNLTKICDVPFLFIGLHVENLERVWAKTLGKPDNKNRIGEFMDQNILKHKM